MGDIRDRLRRDHEALLVALETLREADAMAPARLASLRSAWMIHALAEETVVYKAVETAEVASPWRSNADERFVEHELVEGLFDNLSRSHPDTHEWNARINVARELIARHIETEHDDMFARLGRHFDEKALHEMAERFDLAREKLLMLEEAKAA